MRLSLVACALVGLMGCGSSDNGSETSSVMINPDGRKTPVIYPDSIKISGIEAKLQKEFNSFCETEAKINRRIGGTKENTLVSNEYGFNNGGYAEAVIRTEFVDGKDKYVELINVTITRCSTDIVVVNPDGRKTPVVNPDGRKTPVVNPDGRKTPVVNPDSIKISRIEVELQDKFSEVCGSEAKINRIVDGTKENTLISNEYGFNNGGYAEAVIRIEFVDGKDKHIELVEFNLIRCE